MRIAVALAVSTIVAAAAQQEIPRFRSGVDIVQFTVTVLDQQRRPITGLGASDFEVLVDGKPTPLAAFAAVTLPEDPATTATSIAPVAPDVQTNQLPAEGRLVVIVMDRSTQDGDQQKAHAIANAVIDRLGPNDLGAVVYTGQVSRMYSQGLTPDRARLRAATERLGFGALGEIYGLPSLAVAVATHGATQSGEVITRVPPASEERTGECLCGVCVLDTLTALAKALTGAMERQKSIVFVGSDIAIASPISGATIRDFGGRCSAYIYPARDRLTRALDAANVTFHVVDPHGLPVLEPNGWFRVMSLAVLPDHTGGRTVLNNNRPEEKIGLIFDESRAYYVLAVARDRAASKDDDRHQIKITVKRSDAIVNARKFSFAPDLKAAAARAPNAAAGALNELLPGGGFRLQMNLVPQFAADGSAEIRVLLGVDSAVAGKLDVLIRAYDRVFTPVAEPLKQRLTVPAATVAGTSMFQWSSTLKPPPGDYEVRAAVATADGKRAANVIGYVDVPDAQKQGVALSGITVKSGGTATVQREFGPGAAIGLSFQVARARKHADAVSVRYSIRDDVGQALAAVDVPPERATAISSTVGGYDIGVRLPAVAGRYVVTIEVSDGKRAARRDVPIAVR